MPTMATSENKPRYGHSPILAISAARRSRIVTNECAPRKMTRPRISTARPIGLLNWDYSKLQAIGSVRGGCRLHQQVGPAAKTHSGCCDRDNRPYQPVPRAL